MSRTDRLETPVFVGSAGLLLALVPSCLGGQDLGPLPGVVERSDIRSVEAEGASHPALADTHIDPLYWRENRIPGTDDRRCIDAPVRGPVRSGDFVITYGPLGRPRAGEPYKIAWTPADNAREMSLQVRGQLLGDPQVSFDWRFSSVARPVHEEGTADAEVDDWFFPSGRAFPQAGEWVVVATSGRNWGCFILLVLQNGAR